MVHADEILIMPTDDKTLRKPKEDLSGIFEMKDYGAVKRFLGIKITPSPEGVYMTQTS